MIYIAMKHIRVKKENKNEFEKEALRWMEETKKEELNLSIDGCWKDETNFLIVERWSNLESYNKYIRSTFYKAFVETIDNYISDKMKIMKYNTII